MPLVIRGRPIAAVTAAVCVLMLMTFTWFQTSAGPHRTTTAVRDQTDNAPSTQGLEPQVSQPQTDPQLQAGSPEMTLMYRVLQDFPLSFPPSMAKDVDLQRRLKQYLGPVFAYSDTRVDKTKPRAADSVDFSKGDVGAQVDGGSAAAVDSKAVVEVEFLVCVRSWLYDFLAPRFPAAVARSASGGLDTPNPPPPQMRLKMGEVRTWTSLLTALSLRLGCVVILSKGCSELAAWEHTYVASSTSANESATPLQNGGGGGDQEGATTSTATTSVLRVLRVFLTEDLSLDWLKNIRTPPSDHATAATADDSSAFTPNRSLCRRRAQQTIAIAGAASKFFDNRRVLPLFHIAEHNRSLGTIAECPTPGERDTSGHGDLTSPSGTPTAHAPPKRWFAVLWGKTGQTGSRLRAAVEAVSRYIPVISTCVGSCDPALPALVVDQRMNSSSSVNGGVPGVFAAAIRQAVVLIGIKAPERGAACPEALACGTYVVARGRNFGFEFSGHPLTRRFRKPHEFVSQFTDVLVNQWGFQTQLPFDAQPHAPNRTSAWAPLTADLFLLNKGHERPTQKTKQLAVSGRSLPHRYTQDGYVHHIAQLFAIQTSNDDAAKEERFSADVQRRPSTSQSRHPSCRLNPRTIQFDRRRGGSGDAAVVQQEVAGHVASVLHEVFSHRWLTWKWDGCA